MEENWTWIYKAFYFSVFVISVVLVRWFHCSRVNLINIQFSSRISSTCVLFLCSYVKTQIHFPVFDDFKEENCALYCPNWFRLCSTKKNDIYLIINLSIIYLCVYLPICVSVYLFISLILHLHIYEQMLKWLL